MTRHVLIKHMERIHLKLRKTECKLCDKMFFDDRDYQDHFKNVHGKKNHICILCNKAFGSRQLWKNHMETVVNHIPPGQKYECDFCSKTLKNASVLRYHRNSQKKNVKNAEFACKNCPKAYFNPRDLLRHHCVDSCEITCGVGGCDAKFYRSDYYSKHIRGHSEISEEMKESRIRQARIRYIAQAKSRKRLYTKTRIYNCN